MSDTTNFQIIALEEGVIAVPRGWLGTLIVAPQGGKRSYVSVRTNGFLVSSMSESDWKLDDDHE